ncbi:LacI family DNA-binding transcriptional regulator [Arachidicoccus sp.]|uniref:LacI family DNA-binding transcriptional regulator n=1 Tax=Arachidicoccus sp. TaxID=1872624 RepID=UPI003D1DADAF
MKKLSIVDIAKHLNISKTTVSFILNNRAQEKRISEELVQRVQDFVKEVGYKPNPIAKSLRTGKTKTIGLMIENIADPFFAAIARHIENKANKNGYKIIYCSTDNNTDKTKELLGMFREQNVDGYIMSPPIGVGEEIKSLMASNLPIVFFDRHLCEVETDYVEVDNEQSTLDATQYLIEQGFKHIAFITFASTQTQMQGRLNGYQAAIKKNKYQSYVKEVIFNPNETVVVQSILDFLKKNKGLDAILFGALQAGTSGLKALKKIAPDNLSNLGIISFDDCDVFELFSPPITAIAQPIDQIAEYAIDLLLKRLNNGNTNKEWKNIVIKTELIIRDSSAKNAS